MISIQTFDPKLHDELLLILKLFYSLDEIQHLNYSFIHHVSEVNNKMINTIIANANKSLKHERIDELNTTNDNSHEYHKYLRRYSKLALYETLQKLTKKKLPWGALTGIRPTKLFYELLEENHHNEKISEKITKKQFYVSKIKAKILTETIKNQVIVRKDDIIDYYVNIPFCTSKCTYCSFISSSLKECESLVEPYINALIKEMDAMNNMIKNNNYKVRSIYIGGGTPTSIQTKYLEQILKRLPYEVSEFTVEAGRPDTITQEKLDLLKKYGVTRISINPQSFNDFTLKAIGRNHSEKDIINAYNLALPYGFIINMDLIAGLNGESFINFKNSLHKTIKLNPNNITIHTLSIKRTSTLQQKGGVLSDIKSVRKMVNYSYKTLKKHGYKPYYLYKQKYMIGNLENIGYTKNNDISIFNIDSMEETVSVVACGANAISKRIFNETNKLERLPNLRSIYEYNSRVDEMIRNKLKLFQH